MKKIIIQPICSAKNMKPVHYEITGKKFKSFDGEVYYGMNEILANEISKDDEVKIFTIGSSTSTESIERNTDYYIEEISNIIDSIGAKKVIKSIKVPYENSDIVFESMFSDVIGEIEEDSEVFVDITFGDRIIPFFMFSVVQFAERYLNCTVKAIINMKQDYDKDGKVVEGSHRLNDVTSVYYLNKMVNSMNGISGEAAVKTVKEFLSIN